MQPVRRSLEQLLYYEDINFGHFSIKLQRFDLSYKITKLLKATKLLYKITKPYKAVGISYKAIIINVLVQCLSRLTQVEYFVILL